MSEPWVVRSVSVSKTPLADRAAFAGAIPARRAENGHQSFAGGG